MTLRARIAALVVVWAVSPAARAAAPKDCSKDPAPEGKLVLRIDDQAIPLRVATLRSQQKMSIGGEEGSEPEAFEVFAFSFRDAESIFPPHEVAVSVMVREGESLAGKTFRQLPVADQKQQPTPVQASGTWMPEVQSVEVSSGPDDIDYEHGVLSSLRLDLGERNGDVQPGRIRLCIAAGQTDETFQPEPTRAVLVEGAFEAKQGP